MARVTLWVLLWLAATAGIAACVTRPVTIVVPPPAVDDDEPYAYPTSTLIRT